MEELSRFLSCDWGTSSFRLRIVDSKSYEIIAERVSKEGNAEIFKKWRKTQQPEGARLSFYLDVIRRHISDLEREQGSLIELPVLVSGMASSTIGMMDLPYKELPFNIDGSDLNTHKLEKSSHLRKELFLISGARTETDVMRGEETQLVGCMLQNESQDQLFVHPGTHSKHVMIRNGKAVSLKTFMTGELFSILSSESILASSVKQGGDLKDPFNMKSFEKGVKDAVNGSLLNLLFMVRTNELFRKFTAGQNYFYLSGLLIASELTTLQADFKGRIILAGEDILTSSYLKAFEIMQIDRHVSGVQTIGGDLITARGQLEIFKKFSAQSKAKTN